MKKENSFQINALVKAFAVFETLVEKEQWELADLVKALDIPKTTVHRILMNLQSFGYVEKVQGSNRYAATSKIFMLGCEVINKRDILSVSRPIMKTLSAKIDENINLCILHGIDLILIGRAQSADHVLREDTPLGGKFRSYCSASGKACFSQMTNEKIRETFKDHAFRPQTPNSVTNVEEFIEHVERTREQGYAIETEEYTQGLRAVATPIFDHNEEVVAVVGIAAPIVRFKDEKIQEWVALLIQGAKEISYGMGFERR